MAELLRNPVHNHLGNILWVKNLEKMILEHLGHIFLSLERTTWYLK
jgi:hypothetical protein